MSIFSFCVDGNSGNHSTNCSLLYNYILGNAVLSYGMHLYPTEKAHYTRPYAAKVPTGTYYRLILHCRKWRNQCWHWVWLTPHDSINTPVSWSASLTTGEHCVPIPNNNTHIHTKVSIYLQRWGGIVWSANDLTRWFPAWIINIIAFRGEREKGKQS